MRYVQIRGRHRWPWRVHTSEPAPSAGEARVPAPARHSHRVWVVVAVVVVVLAASIGVGYYVLRIAPAAGNHAPVAVIHGTDLAPATYENVTFNGSASYDSDGDALAYAWTLPDGSRSDRVAVSYEFDSAGTFSLTLVVTDSRGAQNTSHLGVPVHRAPLRVGTDPPYPPFESLNGTSLEGFDIDLGDAVAAGAEYAPMWANVADFSVLIAQVGDGTLDMGASAIQSSGTVGASYNRTLYFSNPYFLLYLGVLVRTSDSLTCSSSGCTPAALANRTVGVQSGSAAQSWVDEDLVATNLTPSSDVYVYSSVTNAIVALQTGNVEMLVLESYAAQSIANASGGAFRVAGLIDTGVTYAFAFPRTSVGLVLAGRIDSALQAIIQSGTYRTLYLKWFGG